MKKTGKWIHGLSAVVFGVALLGGTLPAVTVDAALPMTLAAEDTGPRDGLGGDGEYKYNVRRGMYQKEGGADHHVKPGRYKQPRN